MHRLVQDLKRRGAVLVITGAGLLVSRPLMGESKVPLRTGRGEGPEAGEIRRPHWLRGLEGSRAAASVERPKRERRRAEAATTAARGGRRDRWMQRARQRLGDDGLARLGLTATPARPLAAVRDAARGLTQGLVVEGGATCGFAPDNPTLIPLGADGFFGVGGLVAGGPSDPAALPLPTEFLGYQSRVTFGDVDRDGDLDLLVGEKLGSKLHYLENIGTASSPHYLVRTGAANPMDAYTFEAGPPGNEQPQAPAPALGDVNEDGWLDLVVGSKDGSLRYFTGGPGGTFTEVPGGGPFAGIAVDGFAAPTLADIDGDGDLDMAVGSYYYGVYTFLNDGGTFEDITGEPGDPFPPGAFDDPEDPSWYTAPYFADIDGDGDLDAFVGAVAGYYNYDCNCGSYYSPFEPDGYVRFFENTGGAPFVERRAPEGADDPDNPGGQLALGNPLVALHRMLPGPALVDIDADGDYDAFVGGKIGSIGFYENTGSVATAPALDDPAFLDHGWGLTFADLDGDGDQDAFSTFFVFDTKAVTENVASSVAPTPITAGGFSPVEVPGFPVFILHYLNEGSAASPRWELQPLSPFPAGDPKGDPPGLVTFGDVTGDGVLDAFVGTYEYGVQFWENGGTAGAPDFSAGTSDFEEVTTREGFLLPKPALGNVDGDGELDLVVGNYDGLLYYFRNEAVGPGVRQLVEKSGVDNPFDGIDMTPAGSSDPSFAAPYLVDFDLDGDLDLFVGSKLGEVRYYRNEGTSGPSYVRRDQLNPFADLFVSLFTTPAFANVDGDAAVEGYHAGLQAAEAFDQVAPAILVTPTNVVTSETGTSDTFEVVLATQPDGEVTVDVVSSDTTEGTVPPTTLTFDPGNWDEPQTVTVTGVDDALLDGPIPYTLVLSNTTTVGCYTGVDAPDVAAVNLDDETGPVRKTVSGTLAEGGTIVYTVSVTNEGPLPQFDNAGAEFEDVLPPELTLVSATADSGTATATTATNTVTWDGSLAVGETVVISITATVRPGTAGLTISNQARGLFDRDGNGSNETEEPSDDPTTEPLADPTVFVPGTAVQEIPTLSQLAAGLMAALLGLLGWFGLRRIG